MKNKTWWWILLIIIILAFGYFYRDQLKSIFRGTSTDYEIASETSGVIMTRTDPVKGDYLVGMNGMTLYTFDKDQPDANNCSGTCATVWPAYTTTVTPTALPQNLTVFTEPDGIMQYAYNNKPLYFYSMDKQVGDVLGDGVGGVWHLVKP